MAPWGWLGWDGEEEEEGEEVKVRAPPFVRLWSMQGLSLLLITLIL